MNRSRRCFTVGWVRTLKREVKRRFCSINPSPVIVLGNQKAGTSAIAHLTADYAGLSKTIDIPESWWPTLESLLTGNLDLQIFARRNRHRFSADLIKEPNLTFFYESLREVHPEAKFIFVVRDPRSNIRSLLDRLSLPGSRQQIDDMLEGVPQTWRHLFDQDLWGIRGENYVDVLAARWRKAASVYLKHESSMRLVRYEDFLNDKVGTIQALAADLGLDPTCDISDRVDVQYQPRGNRDVSWKEFFGEENLHRIEHECEEEMRAFGYQPLT